MDRPTTANRLGTSVDLLGLTVDGRIVVVELKRDRAPREAVAQALDYASWIAGKSPAEIEEIATAYLKRPLSAVFQERFGQSPEISDSPPTVLVVGSRLDAATERMIQYLGRTFDMDINGLIFRFIQDDAGPRYLIPTLVAEEKSTTPDSYKVTPEYLLSQATDRGVRPMVEVLRKLKVFLWEEAVRTYRGSFRYWGPERMVCGVNVAGYWGAPTGSVDVWIAHGSLAQSGGRSEQEIVSALDSRFEVVKVYEGLSSEDCKGKVHS